MLVDGEEAVFHLWICLIHKRRILRVSPQYPLYPRFLYMGVAPQYRRQGIGRELVLAAQKAALQQGYSFLQVKTVQKGHYPEYDHTNSFYKGIGFQELECFPTLWGETNPCQILVMSL